jgi:hypothetical protein
MTKEPKTEVRKVQWKKAENLSKREAIERRIKEINQQLKESKASSRHSSPYNERFSKTNRSIGYMRDHR